MSDTQQSFDLDENEELLEDLLNNLDHLDKDANLYPAMLSDLIAVVEARLKKSNTRIDGDTYPIAREVVTAIAIYFGGQQLYLPKGKRLELALRDHKIYQRFDGTNHHILAAEYHLTKIQVYAIIAKQRLLQRSRHQISLFN